MSQISTPSISVVVPVFNNENQVGEALESILRQSYRPLEIIVIDDGSTDSSAAIIGGFGRHISYHYQPNSGSAAARNRGVVLSTGEYLAFLDADDLWAADKLTRQVAAFEQEPRLDAVFGHVVEFYQELSPENILSGPLPGHHPGTLLIRRSAFLRVGFFATACQLAEVVDWYARALEVGINSRLLPDILMYRRIHAHNKGLRNRQASRTAYLQVLKAHLDRQKK